jgi:serine/threonine protein kinase
LCDFEMISDLFEYSQILFIFLMIEKNYKQNYFEKNVRKFMSKEYNSVVGIVVNIIALIKYASLTQNFKNDEKNFLEEKIIAILNVLENNRRSFDVFMKEISIFSDIYKVYSINQNLLKKYKELMDLMDKRKRDYPEEKFKIKFFLKNYMNFITRMPDIAKNVISKEKALQNIVIEEEGRVFRVVIKRILKQLKNLQFFKLFISKILNLCPAEVLKDIFYERLRNALYKKLKIEKEEDPEENILKMRGKLSKELITRSQRMLPIEIQEKINAAVQVENIQKYLEEQKQIEKRILELKKQIEEEKNKEEVKITEVIRYVDVEVEEGEDFDEMNQDDEELNSLTLEKFLIKEFSSSINEWIIDYDQLILNDLIASGSTCQVYKGRYKNNNVAIKKIIGIENSSKMKFLKEFKREISLLISVPGHSNLMNFLGICVNRNDVYLITEYCEGGTLFDILYRESLPFNLTYKQKIKIIIDIAKGMQFLHELRKPIIHRDLKTLK